MAVKGIIFDYSGTLSIGAVLFSAPERLAQALRQSGLYDLGVTTHEAFWERIVNPTWEQGSTTSVGYKQVMAQRLSEVFGHEPSVAVPAASRFVDDYFGQSTIDPGWRPLLKKLAADPSVKTIVASDHYAEATDVIIGLLSELGVRASSIRGAAPGTRNVPFLVANSADIGFHKASEHYWAAVKKSILPERFERLLLVDDFGANEQQGDSYAEGERVAVRRTRTVDTLKEVFDVEVEVFPFIAAERGPDGGVDDRGYGMLICEASARVIAYCAGNA